MEIRCKCCGKTPSKINEYVSAARECECTPEEYVVKEEGTYNPRTGMFYCTCCYIKLGCPSGRA